MELLPTPNTMDTLPARSPEKIAESKLRAPAGYRNLREVVVNEDVEVVDYFPTPVASEAIKATAAQGSERKSQTGQVWLTNIAHDLATSNGLPVPIGNLELMGTPRTSSAKGATAKQVEADAPKARLEDQVLTISWGKYEPAIRRWEAVVGRPAPSPVLPDGKDGANRLSKWFAEWLMGLPEGWICSDEIGLTRTQALKATGNGVVPQQAYLALSILLNTKPQVVSNE